MTRVVLVRPWTDARAGGGCCGGEVSDRICLDGKHPSTAAGATDPVGETWRLLRRCAPDVDVEVVDVSNSAYLLPSTFLTVRRRAGLLAGLRAAVRAATAGAVLVDGENVGRIEELGAEGVLEAVRSRVGTPVGG